MKKKTQIVHGFVITVFVLLYAVVSIISTIHVISFFELSNPRWLAISLAIAFEIGAAASLAALVVLERVNMRLVWFLFILLTGMQMMGNTYHAFTNVEDYQSWIELFGLTEETLITQKRILSIISGALLPVVALGFIKALVDYIKPQVQKRAALEEGEEYIPPVKTVEEDEVEESVPTTYVDRTRFDETFEGHPDHPDNKKEEAPVEVERTEVQKIVQVPVEIEKIEKVEEEPIEEEIIESEPTEFEKQLDKIAEQKKQEIKREVIHTNPQNRPL